MADRPSTTSAHWAAKPTATSTYRLVETKLGRSLATYLRSAREAKKPFHVIGYELNAETGEAVHPETIRLWVRSLEESTGEETSQLPGHDRRKPAA